MATTLYFVEKAADQIARYVTGNNDTKLDGSSSAWDYGVLTTTRSVGSLLTDTVLTVDGPTSGVEIAATNPIVWHSAPLGADVTISGSITWNLWAHESAMTANVAINGRLEVVDGATGAFTLIDQTARVTELGTSSAVNNFAETPAAGVDCKKGDRLRVRIFGDDAGTMNTGATFSFSWNGPTGGASGDSFLTLTENLTFAGEPSGTTVYLTNTAATDGLDTASTDYNAWTTRGDSVVTATTTAVNGWTAPIQVTGTGGGTVIDWFTPRLAAVTISGTALFYQRGSGSGNSPSSVAGNFQAQIAVVDADGSNPVVWGVNGTTQETSGTPFASSGSPSIAYVSGDDLSVAGGQRLRIRVYIDDAWEVGPMTATGSVIMQYDGATGGGNGDTYVTFTQSLSVYDPAADARVPRPHPYRQLLPR